MSEATAQVAEEAPATRRGRPRPTHTIERDRRLAERMASLQGDNGQPKVWTVKELAESVGWEQKHVYASLNRLQWGNMVEKEGRSGYRRTGVEFHSDIQAPPRPQKSGV